MVIPECPKFKKGGGCPRSDVVCLSESDAGGAYYTFGCRTCRTGFAVSTPRGAAAAAFQRELQRNQSLRPTAADRVHFDLGAH